MKHPVNKCPLSDGFWTKHQNLSRRFLTVERTDLYMLNGEKEEEDKCCWSLFA